ncbi:MAG: Ig-like domain-containing protein [Acidimicrobiales bacterium]|nr:Ig-like domain-containing protein [Acidimicrobiales bacterium]MCB9374100.1 Ig-like domain-containing protein [Microthrixaceae bacterium]
MLRKLVAGCTGVLVALGAFGVLADRAGASGVTTHAWMAMEAVNRVEDPQLRALLEANIDQISSGGHFPDSGYANPQKGFDSTYGEEAHWPRFSYAYLDQIRDDPSCGDLTAPNGPCAARIAHAMGAMAHGVGDEVWDWLFEPQAPDRGESYIPPALANLGFNDGGLELQMDLIAIGDHARPTQPPLPDWPAPDRLLGVFADIGRTDIEAQDLLNGQESMLFVRDGERFLTRNFHDHITTNMPWTAAHMITAAGGIEFAATAIAANYESMWGRLLGDQPPTEVAITYPADGQQEVTRFGWDRATFLPGSAPTRGGAETRIVAVLSASLPYRPNVNSPNNISATLPPGAMTLTEAATGTPVPLRSGYPRIVPYTPEAGEHTIAIQPDGNLAKCTEYRVSVTEALIDGAGEPVVPYSWTFTTKGCPGVRARPDAQVRVGDDGVWMGWDVFSRNGADQNRSVTTPTGSTATFTMRFRNDGNRWERFTLKGQKPLAGFGVRYYDEAGTDITRGIRLGTYRTAGVRPGDEVLVEMRVEVRANAGPGASITRRIKAISSVDRAARDAVTATVTQGAEVELAPTPGFEPTEATYRALAPGIVCLLG